MYASCLITSWCWCCERIYNWSLFVEARGTSKWSYNREHWMCVHSRCTDTMQIVISSSVWTVTLKHIQHSSSIYRNTISHVPPLHWYIVCCISILLLMVSTVLLFLRSASSDALLRQTMIAVGVSSDISVTKLCVSNWNTTQFNCFYNDSFKYFTGVSINNEDIENHAGRKLK